MNKTLVVFAVLFISLSSNATTWDEPWQQEIIEKSEYFILGSIKQVTDTTVTVQIEKSFASDLKGDLVIDGFFMLHLCSSSGGHGPEFYFAEGEEGYLFLKKGENGNYLIPTPTSGFDRIINGKVHATYRHTYHQAAVDPATYEMTYNEIWNKYHSQSIIDIEVKKYINDNLSKKPAGFDENEIDLFFNQHVALETAFLLELEVDFETLKKFAESDNYHSQISALRAMGISNNKETKEYLLAYIQNSEKDNFTKVVAIWSLWNLNDSAYNKKLSALKNTLSD
ncbi:MAG: hypothetical protein JW870_05380, partial [Candidatus Delongbacteria bacterium]|nr:hypothetical protein [Candidatus Delongbacteria bacterium]